MQISAFRVASEYMWQPAWLCCMRSGFREDMLEATEIKFNHICSERIEKGVE